MRPRTTGGPSSRRTRLREIASSLALSLGTLALLAIALEAAVRVERGQLLATDKARKRALGLTDRPIAIPDPRLGHIPTPNLPGRPLGPSSAPVTTDADGVRGNGPDPRPGGAPILAVGDSFTFGLDVADEDTWPAHLERTLARPVWNGGVFGYGLDQIVLRAEQLLATRPDVRTVILGVFGDDVERCEYSYLFAPKPWFDLVDGELALRNVPVPAGHAPVPLARLRGACSSTATSPTPS